MVGIFLCTKKRTLLFLSYSYEVRKMKCWNCHKRKRDSYWNLGYCPVCGLYQKEIKLEKVTEHIDEMIDRWNTRKQFNYYEICIDDHIRIIHRGVKKLINYISWGEKITLLETEELIKLISYISREFETNITEMAVNLFGFICCHLGMYRDIFQYWLKRGKKEGVRVAYDYLIGGIFSNGEDETKRGKRKLRKLQDQVRHLPNYRD